MSDLFFTHPDHQPFAFDGGASRALLIHGFLGSPREMRPLAEALAAAGVAARGVALPGFGRDFARLRQVRVADWLTAARSAWVETRAGARHTTLIGFSMGGAVALRLAAELELAPDRLILLAPHWKFADRRGALLPMAKYLIRDFRLMGRIDFDDPEVRRAFADMAPDANLDDPAVQRQLRQAASIPTRALDELRRVGLTAAAAAPRVAAPTTILQGLQDTVSLPAYSRALAARMGADLREMAGDHLIVDPSKPSWPAVRDIVAELARGTRIG
jgi:carboxylesterase